MISERLSFLRESVFMSSIAALIPTYNRRSQVCAAIESVLSQTVKVDEIIVIDDGSTDGTSDAIRTKYGSRVILFSQENAGASAARNHGIREAKSDWIAFLDSDDIWLPTKIERQLEALGQFGYKAGFCFTDITYHGNPEMMQSGFESTGFAGVGKIGILADPVKCILTRTEPFYTPSCLIRRSLIVDAGGFDECLVVREDTDLFFRLCFKTDFCYVGEKLVQVDRDPSRDAGLCDLYATRDDRKNNSSERLHEKWLAMPELAGSGYEQSVKELLRLTYYISTENRLHQLRIMPALCTIRQLRNMGYGYLSIVITLLARKLEKLRQKRRIVL
jgi:glycosyltransferase involved in cell wall biosynthesis